MPIVGGCHDNPAHHAAWWHPTLDRVGLTTHTTREFGSLEEFNDWNARNPLVKIHVINYWCKDASGLVGAFRYNGIVVNDDGWEWRMIVKGVPDVLHAFRGALDRREAHLNKIDDDAAAVPTWRPERVRGVVHREDTASLALAA